MQSQQDISSASSSESALVEAVREGDKKVIDKLLKSKEKFNWTLLLINAIKNNDKKVITFLKGRVDFSEPVYLAPLIEAANNNQWEGVDTFISLIKTHPDTFGDYTNHLNYDPNFVKIIRAAVEKDKTDLAIKYVDYFVGNFSNFSSFFTELNEVLFAAIEKNNLTVLRHILKKRLSIPPIIENDETPLSLAAKLKNWPAVLLLLTRYSPSLQVNYHKALLSAISFNQLEVTIALLSKKDIGSLLFSPIHNKTGRTVIIDLKEQAEKTNNPFIINLIKRLASVEKLTGREFEIAKLVSKERKELLKIKNVLLEVFLKLRNQLPLEVIEEIFNLITNYFGLNSRYKLTHMARSAATLYLSYAQRFCKKEKIALASFRKAVDQKLIKKLTTILNSEESIFEKKTLIEEQIIDFVNRKSKKKGKCHTIAELVKYKLFSANCPTLALNEPASPETNATVIGDNQPSTSGYTSKN